jgi:alkylated DNA repair dioxygenase AlkB
MSQMDLFGDELSGPDLDVTLVRQAFGPEDSAIYFERLIQAIPWQQDEVVMFGKKTPLPRLTAWFGDRGASYTYSGITMQPHEWSEDLLAIRAVVEQHAKVRFNSLLLNQYRNGQDGVAWHADDEPELGAQPIIGSLSFGAVRKFQLRLKNDPSEKREIELESGDLVVMSGRTQISWLHQVPKTSRVIGPRINLTFRQISSA